VTDDHVFLATNESDEGIQKPGVCRKQWAAPCGSPLFANANMTSSSAGSVTDSDSAVTIGDTLHSLPGCSLPASCQN